MAFHEARIDELIRASENYVLLRSAGGARYRGRAMLLFG